MCKGTSKSSIHQEKTLFSLPEIVSDKKIRVDFDSPDISSNGGLVLIGNMQNSLAWQIGQLIPDSRKKEFIHHTYMEMVSLRVVPLLSAVPSCRPWYVSSSASAHRASS